jgi:hypothetical protein
VRALSHHGELLYLYEFPGFQAIKIDSRGGKPPVIVCFFNARHRGIWANLEDAVARMSEKVWEYALTL